MDHKNSLCGLPRIKEIDDDRQGKKRKLSTAIGYPGVAAAFVEAF
jgi:hypothetical protein